MASRRLLLWPLIAGGVLLLLLGIALPAEIIARTQIANAVEKVAATFPGVRVSPGGGLALWQLATGRLDVTVALPDEALGRIVECRTDRDVSVSATPAGIVAETTQTISGMSIAVGVLLVPERTGTGWLLAPDSITAGGVSLPLQRAATLLGDREGPTARLLDGFPLPSTSTATVTDVALAQGEVRLTVALPLRIPTSSAAAAPITDLSRCLDGEDGSE